MSDPKELLLERLEKEENPIAKARLISYLMKNHGVTNIFLAKRLKVSKAYISSLIRILKLPELVLEGYFSNIISVSHLFVIARLDNAADMVYAYEEILKRSLTTSATDDLVRTIKHQIEKDGSYASTDSLLKLEDLFRMVDPNFEVKIQQTRIRLVIRAQLKGSMAKTSKVLDKLASHILSDRKQKITEM